MTKAIYPGTFDPITKGHIDVIKRAAKVCDKLYIAVAEDSPKSPLFNIDERIKFIQNEIANSLSKEENNIEVISFDGLLVTYARENNIDLIIRGLRAVSDFEYEFQLASMNARIDENIQTVFIPASENRHFIASKLVKEVARLGGDVSQFVSAEVEQALKAKYDK